MKMLALFLLSLFLLVGCGDNLDDPETRDRILEEAMDIGKLEAGNEKGEALICAPNSQAPYTGWVKAMPPNGTGLILFQCKNGKQHGLATEWYESGQKKYEFNLKDGVAMTASSWLPDGSKCSLTNLKNGNGVVVKYHENGQKEQETNYKDGEQHGLKTWWRENGQKGSETNYKDGKKHGLSKEWYENGQKEQETTYKDGKKHGLSTWWYENGQKMLAVNYHYGKHHGLRITWHENGQKSYEGNWNSGEKNGLEICYDKEGLEIYSLKEGWRQTRPKQDLPKYLYPWPRSKRGN